MFKVLTLLCYASDVWRGRARGAPPTSVLRLATPGGQVRKRQLNRCD